MTTTLCPDSFREIHKEDQQQINGGILPIIVSIGLAVFTEIISDWDNFKAGLTGEPEEKK